MMFNDARFIGWSRVQLGGKTRRDNKNKKIRFEGEIRRLSSRNFSTDERSSSKPSNIVVSALCQSTGSYSATLAIVKNNYRSLKNLSTYNIYQTITRSR
ncbi:hypothetical protein IV203_016169 [Nitzschia inconspicua]|uniref:Uncharacterized protein n=1 Tax=Nitzschia inconspicua TaxID=303405 RepID=A0A9K3KPF3_9STRA|nr:hypothetical protein IV203_016169 [Nitzschia inconspicua]